MQDHTDWYDDHVIPLRRLAREVTSRGLDAHPVPDQGSPYLRVTLPGTGGYQVRLAERDGKLVFEWGEHDETYPTSDPEGAALRIAAELAHEQARAS